MTALLFAVRLVALIAGADLLVRGASRLAQALGVSPLVIGLTVVAYGTSSPEVAVSVGSVMSGKVDLAVGSVVGSNIFNILGCIGLAGVVSSAPLAVAPALVAFDLPVMLAVAVACLPIFLTGATVERWEGAVFVGYYVAYTAYLVLRAAEHDALPAFSQAMLGFVVPITVITLTIVAIRQRRSA